MHSTLGIPGLLNQKQLAMADSKERLLEKYSDSDQSKLTPPNKHNMTSQWGAVVTIARLDVNAATQQWFESIREQMENITASLQEVLNGLSRVESSSSNVESTLRDEHAKVHQEVCNRIDTCEGKVMQRKCELRKCKLRRNKS